MSKSLPDWKTCLFAVYFFASSAVFVSVAAVICAGTALFDRNRRLVHKFASWWGYHYICLNPHWQCRFSGRNKVDWSEPAVIVANHQSYWDILVLYGLNVPFKWVAKESIARMPFIGWNMYLNQYVFVRRGELSSIKSMLAECRKWLGSGVSVLIFPEGTRSEDGSLGQFREGAFRLAVQCGVPVVPIVLSGTRSILPKNGSRINFKQGIEVSVLPPIKPHEYNNDHRAVMRAARQQMNNKLLSLPDSTNATGEC